MRIVYALGMVIMMLMMGSVGYYTMTPAFRETMTALNSTAYAATTGDALTHVTRIYNGLTAMWGPIGAVLLLGLVLYYYIYAQRKEYVTDRGGGLY